MKFERILVPVEGNRTSQAILFEVERLLMGSQAEVELLRVVIPHRESWLERLEHLGETERAVSLRLEEARRELKALAEQTAAHGVRVSWKVVMGDAADRIIEYIAATKPSLVAMAAHTKSGPARVLRGSVALRVLKGCAAPLLLFHPPQDEPGSWHLRFDRILVPLDGSARSAEILPLVEIFARQHSAEVILLHMTPRPLMAGATPLDEVVARLRAAQITTRPIIEVGEASAGILNILERERVDLLAMSTHGYSGSARWAFGSVALTVLRECHVPLLVTRSLVAPTGDPD